MSAHTPGPWIAFIDRRTKTLAVSDSDAHTSRDAIVNWTGFDSSDKPFSQKVANCRLIAAAPDLLKALEAYVSQYGRPHRDEWINDDGFKQAIEIHAQAVSAIAAAKGEQ